MQVISQVFSFDTLPAAKVEVSQEVKKISQIMKGAMFLCEKAPVNTVILFYKNEDRQFFLQKKKNGWDRYSNPANVGSVYDYDVSDDVSDLVSLIGNSPAKIPMLELQETMNQKMSAL